MLFQFSSVFCRCSLHGLASVLLGPTGARLALAAGWLALAAWVMRRGAPDPLHRAAVLLGGLLLVLPTIHPWYLYALLPLLCLFPWWGWIAVTGTLSLTWLQEIEIAATGEWVAWPWLRVPVWAPLLLWLGWRAWRSDAATRLRHRWSTPADASPASAASAASAAEPAEARR